MPYVERVTKAGNTIEIERYFTSRYKKKGISRGDKVKPTKEEQEKVNTRQAERKLRILINANYGYGDYHLVLDYIRRKGEPDRTPEQMRQDIDVFLRECRKEYRKAGLRKRVQAMAADTTTLTEKMRAALRISSTSEKITEEINDCIAACKADMENDGVKVIKETDGLIIRAITLYCKAEFGFNNAAEQFRKSYDALKMRLSLSAEYNTAPQVSETDTNSTESGV